MSRAIFISLYLNEKNIIFDVGMNIIENGRECVKKEKQESTRKAWSSSFAYLERHLEFLRVVLRSIRQGENRHPVWPPVDRGTSLVLAGIRVQHPAAAHHVGDHVEITAQIGITEIREDGAITMHLLHIVGEALLADAH